MDNNIKAQYIDIVKMMQKNKLQSPDVDVLYQEKRDQKWSGTEYNASAHELELFERNIIDWGIHTVPKVGDTNEFGNGLVITYFHEESLQQNEEITHRTRAYTLDFQCDVSLILCLFEELDFYEGEFEVHDWKVNFYDTVDGSRDPSDKCFKEMSEDVEEMKLKDQATIDVALAFSDVLEGKKPKL